MGFNAEMAEILMDYATKRVSDIAIYEEGLRFKCRRCAIFCCRLGGPQLTQKDVQRIEQAGYREEGFFESCEGKDSSVKFLGGIRGRADGSCVFLEFNPEEGNYACSIYDSRPALCRLYPFDFYQTKRQSIVLRVIPCCRGLNAPNGEIVDEQFIASSLIAPILDLTY